MNIIGRALVLRGDDVDTDRIMPARFLRSVSFDGLIVGLGGCFFSLARSSRSACISARI